MCNLIKKFLYAIYPTLPLFSNRIPKIPLEMWDPLPIKISVQYTTKWGQFISIVGSHPILGSWDSSRALKMKWSRDHWWEISLKLPPGSVEFKFILQAENSPTIHWEQGNASFHSWASNHRYYISPPPTSPSNIICIWGNFQETSSSSPETPFFVPRNNFLTSSLDDISMNSTHLQNNHSFTNNNHTNSNYNSSSNSSSPSSSPPPILTFPTQVSQGSPNGSFHHFNNNNNSNNSNNNNNSSSSYSHYRTNSNSSSHVTQAIPVEFSVKILESIVKWWAELHPLQPFGWKRLENSAAFSCLNILDLPHEIMLHIFNMMEDPVDLISCQLVKKKKKKIFDLKKIFIYLKNESKIF
jgi:hypothetical protein